MRFKSQRIMNLKNIIGSREQEHKKKCTTLDTYVFVEKYKK